MFFIHGAFYAVANKKPSRRRESRALRPKLDAGEIFISLLILSFTVSKLLG